VCFPKAQPKGAVEITKTLDCAAPRLFVPASLAY
jgi:hypothetical protein